MPGKQGGTAEIPFAPDRVKDFCLIAVITLQYMLEGRGEKNGSNTDVQSD